MAADAREEVIALADAAGALLVSSLPARGWLGGHPYDLGTSGGFATELTRETLKEMMAR